MSRDRRTEIINKRQIDSLIYNLNNVQNNHQPNNVQNNHQPNNVQNNHQPNNVQNNQQPDIVQNNDDNNNIAQTNNKLQQGILNNSNPSNLEPRILNLENRLGKIENLINGIEGQLQILIDRK